MLRGSALAAGLVGGVALASVGQLTAVTVVGLGLVVLIARRIDRRHHRGAPSDPPNMRRETTITSIQPTGSAYRVTIETSGTHAELETDLVVHGAGRVPQLSRLDLDAANVAHDTRAREAPGCWIPTVFCSVTTQRHGNQGEAVRAVDRQRACGRTALEPIWDSDGLSVVGPNNARRGSAPVVPSSRVDLSCSAGCADVLLGEFASRGSLDAPAHGLGVACEVRQDVPDRPSRRFRRSADVGVGELGDDGLQSLVCTSASIDVRLGISTHRGNDLLLSPVAVLGSVPAFWDRLRIGRGISSAGAVARTQHDVVDVVGSRGGPGWSGSLLVDLDVPCL